EEQGQGCRKTEGRHNKGCRPQDKFRQGKACREEEGRDTIKRNPKDRTAKDDTGRPTETAARGTSRGLPSETEILEFLQTQTGRVGKREIARAFNIKGADRIPLKQMLKEMTSRGLVRRESRTLEDTKQLPPVTVLQVIDV